MEKINVPALNVGERMFISAKCVVIFGGKKPVRIYNMKGKLLGEVSFGEVSDLINEKALDHNIVFGEKMFIVFDNGVYYVKDYKGNVIQKYDVEGDEVIQELKGLGGLIKKPFYKGFRKIQAIFSSDKVFPNLGKIESGSTIWESYHYLIVKNAKNELKIYNTLTDAFLGTIPNFDGTQSFNDFLEENCYWFGPGENMLIKEKGGWTIVTFKGIVLAKNIADELVQIINENKEEKSKETFEYNGIQVQEGECVCRYERVFIVKENSEKAFRFYSLNGDYIKTAVTHEKNSNVSFFQTENWIAIEFVKALTVFKTPHTIRWEIFDYSGKTLYKAIHKMMKKNHMYFALGIIVDSEEEGLLVFNSKGELQASFKGVDFDFYDDYVRVYTSSTTFEVYDYAGNKLFPIVFDTDNDILYEDIIFNKSDNGGEYFEYDLVSKKVYKFGCEEIRVLEDCWELIVLVKRKGHYGILEHLEEENGAMEFHGFNELIPIKYDKITFNHYYYAKYQKNNNGKLEAFEDIYDQDGNLIITVKL